MRGGVEEAHEACLIDLAFLQQLGKRRRIGEVLRPNAGDHVHQEFVVGKRLGLECVTPIARPFIATVITGSAQLVARDGSRARASDILRRLSTG